MSATQTSTLRAGAPAGVSLRVLVGAEVQVFALPAQGRHVVGRGDDAHVLLAHPSVSRRHARLVLTAGEGVVEDLGSANGTRVGRAKLTSGQAAPLEPGVPITFGDVVAVFVPAPATARPEIVLGREELLLAVTRALEDGHASVASLRGPGVARVLERLATMCPVSATVAAVSEANVAVVLPGVARGAALALFEAIAGPLASAVASVRASPEDGATAAALCPEESADVTSRAAGGPAPRPSGEGLAMRALHELVERVAPTPASVLVLGETGTGKEVMARRIHARSTRARGPFVALNCAALAESLLESELFGHEKGAFTGAQSAKEGLVEAAEGGTLFLDELGEMPLSTQAKLLRVLEERAVLRVGSVKPRPVDIRLVAATNRDLQEAIRERVFRADLYYRVNSIVLRLPPLRERREEVLPLAEGFARAASELLHRPAPRVPEDVAARLLGYDWPGNIRELRNVVERLVLLAPGSEVSAEHLPEELREAEAAPALPAPGGQGSDLVEQVAEVERRKIVEALDAVAGNQTRAASLLGISRRALVWRMEKYNLPRPRR